MSGLPGRTGIRKRHITQSESTSDLATEVLDACLKKRLTSGSVGFTIVATISPDSMMPTTAARVQAKIGLKAFVLI